MDAAKKQKSSWFNRFLNGVEYAGNRLPHPITIFALLAAAIAVLSWLLAAAGVSATGEVIDPGTMELTVQTVSVVNLLNRQGLRYMLTHVVSNFTEFAPLGVVLVTMLGVGCAEGSGYLSALMKKAVSLTPAVIVTPMLVFLGVMSNVASDVGYVVLIPLGAVIFMAYGRYPMAGLAAVFAGVSGGFSANLLIGTLDPMLAGISSEAAGIIAPGYEVDAAANWYFMIVSTALIVAVGTWVTDRLVEPRLSAAGAKTAGAGTAGAKTAGTGTAVAKTAGAGTAVAKTAGADTAVAKTVGAGTAVAKTAGADTVRAKIARADTAGAKAVRREPAGRDGQASADPGADRTTLNEREQRALKYANLSLLLTVLAVALLAWPPDSFLRNEETGSLFTGSPFLAGLIVIIALLFFIPSVVYGRIVGTYQGEKDVCAQLGKNMEAMGGYIALTFAAAQFVNYFNYTKLGTILALRGAEFLGSTGVSGPVLMVLFILLSGGINLLMGSASAKWTILAPVFVPMFMLLGYAPELTQVAYRIGDSCTNLITPLMSYFAMVVVYAKKYDPKSGIGTLISTMLPYSLFFLVSWSVLLVIWMAAGLPLGPGAPLYY